MLTLQTQIPRNTDFPTVETLPVMPTLPTPTICTICKCKEREFFRTLSGVTCRSLLLANGDIED